MKIGILGTGMVGNTIGNKLIKNGHHVMMGSRTASNKKAEAWVLENGKNATQGTFADAAQFGELVFNCTGGMFSIAALTSAGSENLDGKIIIDVSNPLDFSKGFPPSLSVCNSDSTGEQIQRTFPNSKVVKTLNTMSCNIMVDPSLISGDHDVFVGGNDAGAKEKVTDILKNDFGWKSIVDLGDITSSRATEMMMPIWLRLYGIYKTGNLNYRIVR